MFLALLGAATSAGVVIPFGLGMWAQLVEGRSFGQHPMSNAALALIGPLAMMGSLLPLVVLSARLIIEVRTDGITIRLTRLGGGQTLQRADVTEARLVRLGLLEIGRKQAWRKRVYRFAGSEGVELRRASGGVVVVSSEHPQRLLRAIRSMLEPEPGR